MQLAYDASNSGGTSAFRGSGATHLAKTVRLPDFLAQHCIHEVAFMKVEGSLGISDFGRLTVRDVNTRC